MIMKRNRKMRRVGLALPKRTKWLLMKTLCLRKHDLHITRMVVARTRHLLSTSGLLTQSLMVGYVRCAKSLEKAIYGLPCTLTSLNLSKRMTVTTVGKLDCREEEDERVRSGEGEGGDNRI